MILNQRPQGFTGAIRNEQSVREGFMEYVQHLCVRKSITEILDEQRNQREANGTFASAEFYDIRDKISASIDRAIRRSHEQL